MRKKFFSLTALLIISVSVFSLFFSGNSFQQTTSVEAASDNYQIKMPKFGKAVPQKVVDSQKYKTTNYGGYYYSQLTQKQKVVYNVILKKFYAIQSHYIGFKGVSEPDFAVAADAINLETIMMIDTYKFYEENKILYVKIKVYDSKDLKYNIKARKEADKIAKKFKGSQRQIVRQIYNWCTSNIEYTENGSNVRDLYGAFYKNKCLCTGYSKAFCYLCNAKGIKTICVANYAHMWNYVLIKGKWYLVDTTNGNYNTDKYFLKGKETANESIFSNKLEYFKYPELK